MPTPIPELQDLVQRPAEREGLELKSWVDLTLSSARAGIARHLAAIANYGGGYLVFGFNDDGTRCQPKSDVRKLYGHDVIAGIIDRYLQPKFQCEVSFVTHDGVEHAVVWIPPHGATPIISKVNGPHDANGQPQGIRGGQIYIRTPKPESAAITMPDQWRELIQRCVIARRDELVGMFAAMMSGGTAEAAKQDRDTAREKLTAWHRTTQNVFQREAARMEPTLRLLLEGNFVQFSYLVRTRSGGRIPAEQMLKVIEKVNTAVRDTVRYGWSMFYPFTRPEISPRFMTDPAVDSGDTEFLQASLFEEGVTDHLDVWRVSTDGRASLIRNFHEDRFEKRPRNVAEDGRWFDRWLHVRDITEFVRHARVMSEEFSDVQDICFLIEWRGLRARTTATINPQVYMRSHTCHTDQRTVFECFPQAEVIGNLPAVVSRLYAPVDRLFDPRSDVAPEWIRHLMPGFIVPGL